MAWDVAVVDGASATRRHLELALAAAGYRVVGWGDAETARRELVSPPRMLVSELIMDGGMDGFELLGWARARWGMGVALLATTGLAWGQVDLGEVVRERFGARFLRKPYLRSEAVELVLEAIGPGSASQDAIAAPEWRIGVAEAQRAESLAADYERRLVRAGSHRGRHSLRARATGSVRFQHEGVAHQRPLGNLSVGGLFIEAPSSPDPDEILELQIDVPALGRPLRLRTRVAYRVPPDRVAAGETAGFGGEFLDPSEHDRAAIATLVDQLEALEVGAEGGGSPGAAPLELAGREAGLLRRRQAGRTWVLLVGLPPQQLLARPGFLHRRDIELLATPMMDEAESLARLRKPALCIVHESALRLDSHSQLSRLGRLVNDPSGILVLGPTTLSALVARGLCGAVLRPDLPPLLLNDEIRQRLGLSERMHLRVPHRAPVQARALEQTFEAEMIDISVGGMLLRGLSQPTVGARFALTFELAQAGQLAAAATVVRLERGRSERAATAGLVFTEIDRGASETIRRFVQSHVPFNEFHAWLKQAGFG
jgi:hypothetical protein